MPTVVVFSGEYDLNSVKELRRELSRLVDETVLVLDLTEVTFMDCASIAEFVRLNKARKAKNASRETMVVPAKAPVRRIFDLLGLSRAFHIVETLEDVAGSGKPQVVQYAFSGGFVDQRRPYTQEYYRGPERRASRRSH